MSYDFLPTLTEYGCFLDTLPEAALVVGKRGEICLANEMARDVFRSGSDKFHADYVWELIPLEKREGHDEKMANFRSSAQKNYRLANSALEAVRGDGSRFGVVIILRRLQLASGQYTLAICHDVSEQRYLISGLRDELAQERELARIDPLTGIANIRSFRTQLERSRERLSRYDQPFTLVTFDLDNFKPINDRQGHAEGDKVLKLIGQTLKHRLRMGDTPARIGGDEFAILMPDTDFEAAKLFMPRLIGSLEQAMREKDWPVSFSVGSVTFNECPSSVDNALKASDEAMYTAKRQGKDRAVLRVYE